MAQDAALILQANREQARRHQAQMTGIETPAEIADDMALHVGDVINYPQPQQPAPQSLPAAAASGVSNLAKAGIAAAVLGSGGIGAMAAKWFAPQVAAPAAAAVQQIQAADPGVQLRIFTPPENSADGTTHN